MFSGVTASSQNSDRNPQPMNVNAFVLCCCPAGEASEEELKERQAKAMADPEVQNILMDPIMRQVMAASADPLDGTGL